VYDDVRGATSAVAAVARVGRALVSAGSLADLCDGALLEISQALRLDATAMYLPDIAEPRSFRRFATWFRDARGLPTAERLCLREEELAFLVAAEGPIVFRDPVGWVVPNPFEPVAGHGLVVPLISEESMIGIVVGAAPAPLGLEQVAAATLASIGALVCAGVVTARLREELQRTEIQRERMRLAAELHEGLAQDLSLAVREIAFLETDPAAPSAQASRQRLKEAVATAHRVVRAGLADLGAVQWLGGLDAAVTDVCEGFRRRGMDVDLRIEPIGAAVAPYAVAGVVRILHEALANVERHAGVDAADVVIRQVDGRLRLAVSDRGRGFDPDDVPGPRSGHFGLGIMRERAQALGGTFSVGASPAGGTGILLTVPAESSG
jgi:two-component system nitrate/nitrite sensor histidine kinase NarX